MALLDGTEILSSKLTKVIATVYITVSLIALAYALFSSGSRLLWTEILTAAVALFVVCGAWFAIRLKGESLAVIMPLNIVAFIALAVELALIAPQEQTLGVYIRLIYIHAAVTWIGLALFAASFIAGAINLIARNKLHAKWADSLFGNALCFWGASSVIGSIAAYLTWGVDWYLEPRTGMAFIILAISLVAFILGPMVTNEIRRMLLQTAVPVIIFGMLVYTGKLVHPDNAFVRSDSLEIKVFALIITLVFAGVAAQGVRWLAARRSVSPAG